MRHQRRLIIFGLLLQSTALFGALTPQKSAIHIDPSIIPDLDQPPEEIPTNPDQTLQEKKHQEERIISLQKQLDERIDELREMEERLKLSEAKNAEEENLGGQQQQLAVEAQPEIETFPAYVDPILPYIQDQDLPLLSPTYTPEGVYLYERVVAGRGRGFVSEAQALGAFFAFPVTTSGDYAFLDLTGRNLRNNRYGGSYGIGCRSSYFFDNEVVGLNLFYDHAKFLNNDFQQIGVGAELIAPNWEVYLNGYFPIGRKTALECSDIYTYPEDGFKVLIEEEQVSMWGMDIEFGRSLVLPLDRNRNWSFYLGAGPYFYRSSHQTCCDQSLIGGQGRLNVSVGDGVNLDLFVTYDNVYKTRAMLSLTVAFSFGGVDSRPLPVRRNPIPMTKHSCKYTSLGI
jgi:hypothetical protein